MDTGATNNNTLVTITGLPGQMTTNGYDVYFYTQNSITAKGGGYRILDATTHSVLKDYVRPSEQEGIWRGLSITTRNRRSAPCPGFKQPKCLRNHSGQLPIKTNPTTCQ